MNKAPIDYEKTITDTVDKICNYYDKYVEKRAGKMSIEEYNKYKKAINDIRVNGKKSQWYMEYGWDKNYDLFNFAGNSRRVIERFFSAVRDYKDYKAKRLGTEIQERVLLDEVKCVNIKIAGEFLAPLKELFVPASYYVSRVSIVK